MAQDLGSLEKVLRLGEGRRLKRLQSQAEYVASLEPDFEQLSDEELAAKTVEFKQRNENGETLEELLFEAYAAVREAAKRALGQRPFDVQVMGGIVLHEGDIAEMKTGEGKTLVATQPLYLNALAGNGVHLVTVNDYLAKRDAGWMGPVYEKLGMRAAFIENMMPFGERKQAYDAEITYGTNSEFGFDYLRDNMAVSTEGVVQRGPARPSPQGGAPRRGLRVRREAQDDRADPVRCGEVRARARDREPLRPPALAARQPHDPGAEGPVALPPRRRLRHPGRRGEDRRRVHGPDHGRPALERRPPPGGRGEGGRRDPGGARHAGDDHAPELLPPLREARRHDRYGQDRGEGVRRDLRSARRRDPDQRGGRPRRQQRLHLQDRGGEVQRRHRRHRRAARAGPAGPRRDDRGREVGVPLAAAAAARRPTQRPEREGARAGERDH